MVLARAKEDNRIGKSKLIGTQAPKLYNSFFTMIYILIYIISGISCFITLKHRYLQGHKPFKKL